jgi:hypothetical protein
MPMANRDRDEQEMRNGLEVMLWIEHLTAPISVTGVNMYKLIVYLSLTLGFMAMLSGCVSSVATITPTQPAATMSTQSPAPTSSQSDVSLPVLASWIIGAQPVVSRGDFTFAVHMVVVDGERVIVIYSASGLTVDQSFASKSVQLTDETGSLSYTLCPAPFPLATRTPAAYLALTARPQPPASQTLPPYPVASQTPPPPCTPSPAKSVVTLLGQVG